MGDLWQERMERLGHTGWNDPVIYAYDQQERLLIAALMLERFTPRRGDEVALDFGCGSGDFSRLLLERGFRVFGFDPFVQPAIDDPRFTSLSTTASLEAELPPLDLALSITVLDHIVDDDELGRTLSRIRGTLKPGGVFLLYEYALDSSEDASPSMRPGETQAFRTLAEWRRQLDAAGFSGPEVSAVPHPIESPSDGYRAYRKSLVVRAAGRLGAGRFGAVLARVAGRCLATHPPTLHHPRPSPLKLLVARAGR